MEDRFAEPLAAGRERMQYAIAWASGFGAQNGSLKLALDADARDQAEP